MCLPLALLPSAKAKSFGCNARRFRTGVTGRLTTFEGMNNRRPTRPAASAFLMMRCKLEAFLQRY